MARDSRPGIACDVDDPDISIAGFRIHPVGRDAVASRRDSRIEILAARRRDRAPGAPITIEPLERAIDFAHSASADPVEDFVRADSCAGHKRHSPMDLCDVAASGVRARPLPAFGAFAQVRIRTSTGRCERRNTWHPRHVRAAREARTLALERAQRNALTLAERLAPSKRHSDGYPGLARQPRDEAATPPQGRRHDHSFDVRGDSAAADCDSRKFDSAAHRGGTSGLRRGLQSSAAMPCADDT